MVYLYILHDRDDFQYIGSYDDLHDAADHGQQLLEMGDGYWPKANQIVISDNPRLEA